MARPGHRRGRWPQRGRTPRCHGGIRGGDGLRDRRVERRRAPVTVVVRRARAEEHAEEVVAARVIGHPRERPHRGRVGRQAIEVAIAHRLGLESDPELALDLRNDRLIEATATGHQDRRGEPGTTGKAGLGQQRPGGDRVVLRQEVQLAATRDPGWDHRVRDLRRGIAAAQGGHPAPIHRRAERPTHEDVVERRFRGVKAVVLDGKRLDQPKLRAERLVERQPGRIDRKHGGVVEVAAGKGVYGAAAAQLADELDRRDGRLSRPIVWVGGQRQAGRRRPTQHISTARNEPGSGSGRLGARADSRRDDRERRSGHDVHEVGGGSHQIDDHVPGPVIRAHAD